MPSIPDSIGEVTLEFDGSVGRDVTSEMLAALQATIARDAVAGETIEVLWVSSARDRHVCPSRHVTGNGIDISRINGKRIGTHYTTDPSVKAIVDGLQTQFENAPHRRENFGPTIQRKLGQPHPIAGHQDHIHWSVNGDHSACAPSLLQRMVRFLRITETENTTSGAPSGGEVCSR